MEQRLGWTLLHFLWQGTAIAISYAALRALFGRSYGLACGALIAMVVAPVLTFFCTPSGGDGLWTVSPSFVVPVWLAGVVMFSIRLLGGWRLTIRLRSAACAAPAEWQLVLEGIAVRLGVNRPARLLVSPLVDVPTVIGWLRPAILVPVEALAGMPAGHLSALLAHELAHIRRNDYLVSMLQSVAEAVLFYHPAVWWISEQMRREREFCCDDLAVAISGDVLTYVQALAVLESRQYAGAARIAANGGSLVERIRRLIEPGRGAGKNNAPGAAAAWAMAALWIAGVGVTVAHGAQHPQSALVPEVAVSLPVVEAAPLVAATKTARRALQFDPLVAEAAPPQSSVPQSGRKSPWQMWLDEDVAYIATDAERKDFQKLTTDEEREQFVEEFWLRRDPTPGTQDNEYKTEHYRRIEYTNKRYSARVAGWKTDRGKVYIMLGPPEAVDAYPYGAPGSSIPYEQWRYSYVAGIGVKVLFEFRGQDYALQGGPELDSLRNGTIGLNAGKLASTAILPLQVQVDYSRATQGSTLALVTLQIDNKDLRFGDQARVNLFGRITTMNRRPVTTFEKSLDIPLSAAHSRTVYQQSVPLAPGRYRMNMVAKDLASGSVNFYEAALDVPRYEEQKLAAGSLVLADRLEKVPVDSAADPFAGGDMKVHPRIGGRFTVAETMGIYLQAYNFRPDEVTGKPGGSVVYEVLKAGSGEQRFTFSEDVGIIADASASQLTVEKLLPLKTIGPGSYTLRVTMMDRNGKESLQREAAFTVTPE